MKKWRGDHPRHDWARPNPFFGVFDSLRAPCDLPLQIWEIEAMESEAAAARAARIEREAAAAAARAARIAAAEARDADFVRRNYGRG